MKRVLTFLALMLLPLSVMAMTPVSDSTLSDVTGQAGVNINANLTMNITMGTLAWGDSDGIKGSTDAAFGGFVGVTGLNIQNLQIKARTETLDTYGSYSAYSTDPTAKRLQPITIDVARGTLYGGKTFVRIGLGSLQIKMNDLTLGVALGQYASTGTISLNEYMGQLYIGGMNMYISPTSYVDIFSHNNSGVTMNLNVLIDKFALTAVSWGDTDGLAGGNVVANTVGSGAEHSWYSGSTEGFVGLTDIYLGAIAITGQVAIDVATSNTSTDLYLEHYREKVALLIQMANPGLDFPTALLQATGAVPSLSIVHITFGDTAAGGAPFRVAISDYFRAVVKLSSVKQLTGTGYGQVLGDIYLSAFQLDILPGSWVDIWAH